jgi:hypothetical protein
VLPDTCLPNSSVCATIGNVLTNRDIDDVIDFPHGQSERRTRDKPCGVPRGNDIRMT